MKDNAIVLDVITPIKYDSKKIKNHPLLSKTASELGFDLSIYSFCNMYIYI